MAKQKPKPHWRRAISFSMPPELLERVEAYARARRLDRSAAGRELLEKALEDLEAGAAVLSDPLVLGAFARAVSEPGVLRSLAQSLRTEITSEQLALFEQQIGKAAAGMKGATALEAGGAAAKRRRR